MGSITHVVDGEADKILNQYEYDAWGNPTTCNEKVPNRFKFNGQQYDPITQQYYLRARYYNPVIGRFTQEDTYRGDGLNLYAYCAGNPVYYVDPSGHELCANGANKIKKLLSEGKLNEEELSKLKAYLKERQESGKINSHEEELAEQIDLINSDFPIWSVGDPNTKLMPDGSYPIWRTIRERYWKNRAQLDPNGFGPQNIGLMKKGYAPRARVIVRDRKTGEIYEKLVKKEIHHAMGNRGVPGFDEPIYLREVWPWEHEKLLPPGRKLSYDFICFSFKIP